MADTLQTATPPKRKRRQFRELEVVETLLLQGATIICPRCGLPITLEDLRGHNVQKEHKHEFGLDGPDMPANCCFSHAAKPCHALVTHGNGATFAGSSRHKVAKATDPARIEKFKVVKRPLDADAVSEPSGRCRKCGEDAGFCECHVRPARSGFGGRR